MCINIDGRTEKADIKKTKFLAAGYIVPSAQGFTKINLITDVQLWVSSKRDFNFSLGRIPAAGSDFWDIITPTWLVTCPLNVVIPTRTLDHVGRMNVVEEIEELVLGF